MQWPHELAHHTQMAAYDHVGRGRLVILVRRLRR